MLATLVADSAPLGDLWLRAANAALTIGELSLAESAARNFLAVNKGQIQRLVQCAGVIAETGKLEKALKLVRPQLRRSPDDPALNHLSGTIYQQLGDMRLAAKHLRIALKGANLSGITWLTLAAQHKFKAGDALLHNLQQLDAAFARTVPTNQLQYQFAIGKALLDLRQYEQAFDAFAKGAELAPDANSYSAAAESLRVDAVIAAHPPGSLSESAPSDASGQAIFLVGLPRSGTTLLQRILCAHNEVTDGGEFSGMGVATMDSRRRGDTGADALADVRATYAHLSQERFGAKGRIVDKSINNNYYVGTIASAFPTAPIIILERNVRDVAWSCFRTCFSKGMHWSWRLPDIASHIQAELRLIEHWKKVLPERVRVVQYEQLVRHPDLLLPSLFAHCRLEFNSNVYNFYQRKSAVTTASVAQVNQPLNAHSIDSSRFVAHRMAALGFV